MKFLEHSVSDDKPGWKKVGLFMSGSLAGITASVSTYPLEFLRF